MTSPITGPLTRPDQVAVSALLTEAFEADPAYAYFLSGCSPTKKDHYRALLIRFVVAYHCQSGMPVWGTTLNGKLVACALVEAPGPEWRRALALLWQLPRLIGRVPLSSVQHMNQYARVSRQGLPNTIRHYLIKIGVSANHQGQGLGKSLISAIVNHYQQSEGLMGLDTENPDNVPLYEHLGFQLHDQLTLDSLRIYRMYRPLK